MNCNIVIELTTGHGKNPIVVCLTKCLDDTYSNSKVVVVTMNN